VRPFVFFESSSDFISHTVKTYHMASPLPAALKSIQPYLKHAKMLEKFDPLMSYYCKKSPVNLRPLLRCATRCRHLSSKQK
jgi:hypothetical protein